MKNILAILGLLLFAQVGYAQYFTLTPTGFISASKTDYTVVEVPNVKQQDLYQNVLNALNTMYKDPQKVLSVVEGQSITIKGYEEKAIPHKYKASPMQIGKTTYKYDISYTLSILFKDGKIRFNGPTFECRRWLSGYNAQWLYLHLVKGKGAETSVYDKKGEVVSEESYNGLNKHFNDLIKEILDKSKNINDW